MTSSTSKSVSPTLRALTLTLISICGAVWRAASERGALGFSKERSLAYCASTLIAGALFSAAAGPPFPFVLAIRVPRDARRRQGASGRGATTGRAGTTRDGEEQADDRR